MKAVQRFRQRFGGFIDAESMMQVVNSLRSAKQRHPDCQLVKRKGRLYVICRATPLQSGAGAQKTPLTETLQRAALLASAVKLSAASHWRMALSSSGHSPSITETSPCPGCVLYSPAPGENVLRTETPAALPPGLMGY